MESEHIYNILDEASDYSSSRRDLVKFLKSWQGQLPVDMEARRQAVYEIAGLLSTKFASSLTADDPLDAILVLAGELEVPENDNIAKWSQLHRLIDSL